MAKKQVKRKTRRKKAPTTKDAPPRESQTSQGEPRQILPPGPRQITKEQTVILRTLAESAASPGCKFLEVGSWCGDSTLILGAVAKDNGGHLYCVDWWRGNAGTELEEIAARQDIFALFWRRIRQAGLADVVVPIRGKSDVAAKALGPCTFDLVFLDADHRYEGALQDIREYSPLVSRSGGILCGHDCEGRIADFDVDFLEAGKDVDAHDLVHCGVVLAAGRTFDDYSINYSVWSVRAAAKGDGWKPTDLTFPGLDSGIQALPLPLGLTKSYEVVRHGQQVYAVPRKRKKGKITSEAAFSQPGVIAAKTLAEIESQIGERLMRTSVPIVAEVRHDYTLVKYLDRVYACHAGPMDLTRMDKWEIKARQKSGQFMIADSLEEARRLVEEAHCERIQNQLEERLAERCAEVQSLQETLDRFQREAQENAEEANRANKEAAGKLEEIQSLRQALDQSRHEVDRAGKNLTEGLAEVRPLQEALDQFRRDAEERGKEVNRAKKEIAEKAAEAQTLREALDHARHHAVVRIRQFLTQRLGSLLQAQAQELSGLAQRHEVLRQELSSGLTQHHETLSQELFDAQHVQAQELSSLAQRHKSLVARQQEELTEMNATVTEISGFMQRLKGNVILRAGWWLIRIFRKRPK